MKDPYSTLGIKKDADKKEIKSAYRKLAQKYHPDKNPDDAAAEDKFKEVAGAYEMLSDDSKRAEYDQFGFGGPPRGGFGGFNVSDIFSQFHGGFRPRGPRRGKDLQQSITISFMEAALGTEKKIKVEQAGEFCQRREEGVLIMTLMKDYNLSKASVYRYLSNTPLT